MKSQSLAARRLSAPRAGTDTQDWTLVAEQPLSPSKKHPVPALPQSPALETLMPSPAGTSLRGRHWPGWVGGNTGGLVLNRENKAGGGPDQN